MKTTDFMYVKVRLNTELHKKLKTKGQQEERSMNYLINKAVEAFLNPNKGVGALASP